MPNKDARQEVMAMVCFTSSEKGIEYLLKAGSLTRLSNSWHFGTAGKHYTLGQREILGRFGRLFGLNDSEIETSLTIVKSDLLNIGRLHSDSIGLKVNAFSSYTQGQLTDLDLGYALTDILAEAVTERIGMHEADAIIACLGFDSTPTYGDYQNKTRNDFERYLTGKKGYDPREFYRSREAKIKGAERQNILA